MMSLSQKLLRIEIHFFREIVDGSSPLEHLVAEAYELGAVGSEELSCSGDGGSTLRIYSPQSKAQAIEARIFHLELDEIAWVSTYPEPKVNWDDLSRQRHEPITVANRITITPPWTRPNNNVAHPVLVINPGQAFGTGAHESTKVVMNLMLNGENTLKGSVVLDVGCGTGVLALTALACGAKKAIALDIDRLAISATCENCVKNSYQNSILAYCGPISALRPKPFDLILANLLRTELEPIFNYLQNYLSTKGRLILGGLLKSDWNKVSSLIEGCSLVVSDRRYEMDPSGTIWMGLVLTKTPKFEN